MGQTVSGGKGMGQRLVVHVVSNHQDIAAIYYHWSAYTEDTLEEIKTLIDDFNEKGFDFSTMSKEEAQLAVIKTLEANGGGVDEADLPAAKSLFPTESFNESPDRSFGLVAISSGDMANMNQLAEGRAMIDLSKRTFYTAVWDEPDLEDLEWYYPKDLEIARNTPGPDLDRTYDWDEIDDLLEEVENAPFLYSNDGRLFYKIG